MRRKLAMSIRYLILENLADPEADPAEAGLGLFYLKATGGYRLLRDSRGPRFRTFRQFCQAERPYGLGMHPAAAIAILRHRVELLQDGEETVLA
jgi:hypothetical protein